MAAKHMNMRTLRRLFRNKKMWEDRKFVKADTLKGFAKTNKERLSKGVETMSPKVEKLLL